MAKKFTPSKQSIPNCAKKTPRLTIRRQQLADKVSGSENRGLSLVELLVGAVVATGVLGIALSGAMFNRQLFLKDLDRTEVNDRLRSALDLVGADLKQVGERLNQRDPNFPVLSISKDQDGNSIITIRRNLDLPVLRVCNPSGIKDGSSENSVMVYRKGGGPNVPLGCQEPEGLENNEWPPDLEAWINYRKNNGGKIRAFIYNGQEGEFFTYDREDQSQFKIHRESGKWTYEYPNSNSYISLIEERQYRLSDANIIQLTTNAEKTANLVGGISSFEATVIMTDPDNQDSLIFADSFAFNDDWTAINSIQVTLESVGSDSELNSRKSKADNPEGLRLTRQFFPRNILSY